MAERSAKGGSFQGAVVFPGGVLDASDRSKDWSRLYGVRDLSPRQHLKLAAVREMFEETGILLSIPFTTLSVEKSRKLRSRVHADGVEFLKMCEELKVKPDLDALRLVQNWVTPLHVPKQFDTCFFLACLEVQTPCEADGDETVRLEWHAPSAWLQKFENQDVSLLPPQYYLLSILAGTPQLADVKQLVATVDEDHIEPWLPVRLCPAEGPGMCYPGDVSYHSEVVQRDSRPTPYHRMYMRSVPRIEGGEGGRGTEEAIGVLNPPGDQPDQPGSGAVRYELQRNVSVAFGRESWGGRRYDAATSKL